MDESQVTAELIEKMHNAFDAFDEDGDGVVDFKGLVSGLRAIGLNPTQEEIDDMKGDLAGAPISFNTFLYIAFHHSRYVDVEGDLVAALKVFDKEKTGQLPVKTIKSILQSIKRPFTEEQVDDILKHCDVKSGMVDYAQMVNVILSG